MVKIKKKLSNNDFKQNQTDFSSIKLNNPLFIKNELKIKKKLDNVSILLRQIILRLATGPSDCDRLLIHCA